MLRFIIEIAKILNDPKTLAGSGNYRDILPLLTYLENKANYLEIDNCFQILSESVLKQDEVNRGRVIEEIDKFLKRKPAKPNADTAKYRCILKIIGLLRRWNDKRAVPLLENLVLNWNFHTAILQKALVALAQFDPTRGLMLLKKEIGVPDENIRIMVSKMEVTSIEKDSLLANGRFNICANRRDGFYRLKNSCYYFKFEKGLIYFLYGGDEKRLAGWAQDGSESEIVEQAINYLAWWLWSTNSI